MIGGLGLLIAKAYLPASANAQSLSGRTGLRVVLRDDALLLGGASAPQNQGREHIRLSLFW